MRMLENNNRKIITKMAMSSLKGNKPKFAVMIIAVMLAVGLPIANMVC